MCVRAFLRTIISYLPLPFPLVATPITPSNPPFRSDLACKIALDAVSTVVLEENGRKEIDIKRYAKVEKVSSLCCSWFCCFCCFVVSAVDFTLPFFSRRKIPGGEVEDSRVLRGVMINKDVTHAKMRRR